MTTPNDPGTTGRPVARNIAAIAEVEAVARRARTRIDRVTERVGRFAGTPWFIGVHLLWFAGWLGWNHNPLRAFDPYPFNLLTLIVALEAILLSTFVLISQNRMTAVANRREHIDLQINLLTEAEVTQALGLLHRISHHLGLEDPDSEAEVRDLSSRTDVLKVARDVDQHLAGEAERKPESSQ